MIERETVFSKRIQLIRSSGIRKLFDLARTMSGVISLGIGEPDFDTPQHIREAAKRALDAGYTRYTPNAGFPDLREALSAKVAQVNGLNYTPQEVLVSGGGCTGALLLALLTLVDPGDEVIISDPCFVVYEAVARIVGATPVFVAVREEEDFRLIPENVEKSLTTKTKLIILNSPSNPTGGIQYKEDIEGIAEVARKHNLYIVSDEVYETMLYEGMHHHSIAAVKGMRNRTVTVNSFSKTYAMTGWRIGYAVGTREIIDQMIKLQQYTMVHAPAVSQRAALAALNGPQDFIEQMVTIFDERRRFLIPRLNEIEGFRCPTPKGAFYAFPNVEGLGKLSKDMAQILLQSGGVAVVPGSVFGEGGEGYLRLSYAQPLDKLEDACNRIEKVVKTLL
ncbi:MAG: pyridoxal phosphate-dependent aminotransferase [Candidatus Bathyarchaeia archaeon]